MKTTAMVAMILATASTIVMAAPREQPQVDPEALQKGMAALMGALGGATNANAKAAVVDFRELKALLPAELKGLKRTGAKGGRDAAMGMAVARAEGEYEGDNGKSIRIEIVDTAGTGNAAVFAQAALASQDIDEEDDNGYRKTITIGGHKGIEEYKTDGKSGEIQIFVERFAITVHGNEVKAEELRAAVEAIDFGKLKKLRDAGEAKPATPPAPTKR